MLKIFSIASRNGENEKGFWLYHESKLELNLELWGCNKFLSVFLSFLFEL